MKQTLKLIILSFCLSGCHLQSNNTNAINVEIMDMANRKVKIPKHISKVFCSDWTVTMMMYSLAPELLVGRNSKPSSLELSYVTPYFYNLPALGYIFNGKSSVNIEQLVAYAPDILLCPVFQHTSLRNIQEFEDFGAQFGIPVVMVNLDIEKLSETYDFLGKLLHKTKDAKNLAAYCRQTLLLADSVKNILKKPISIFIAEGKSGLHTIPKNSTHSQIFEKIGLCNVAEINDKFGYKDICINIEQIISWNPDYIIVNQRNQNEHTEGIQNNKMWCMLEAVKHHRIISVPNQPFNWVGRPPSINRLIGIQWLIATFYPTKTSINIKKEVNHFYKLFYHKTLTLEETTKLLNPTTQIN